MYLHSLDGYGSPPKKDGKGQSYMNLIEFISNLYILFLGDWITLEICLLGGLQIRGDSPLVCRTWGSWKVPSKIVRRLPGQFFVSETGPLMVVIRTYKNNGFQLRLS